ncbi:polyprenol reductase [Euwallacea fornicatus]|uniref:polyprenol reductase n=1 Tax=Euwallacea fornicatus TaxID=995702 RepID=UPI00338E3DAF
MKTDFTMNLISILFCLLTSTMIIYSSLINLFEPKLPHILSQIFRFGKFGAKAKSKLVMEVPKSWFKHFYICAFIEFTYLIWLVTMVYLFHMKVPSYVRFLLDCLCGTERIAFVPKHKVFIATCLMTIQVYRRLYDTQKISVFGNNSKLNLTHYVIGLIHYPGVILAILSEAPLFANSPSTIAEAPINLLSTTLSDKIAVLIFWLAWKHQFICTKILANLRKDKNGNTVNSEYKLPQGDWFDYLTAPHQTTEIVMYCCITWILWSNITWFFIFTWVLANQIETILLSHWWYQEKFEDFPKTRKALIPFLY